MLDKAFKSNHMKNIQRENHHQEIKEYQLIQHMNRTILLNHQYHKSQQTNYFQDRQLEMIILKLIYKL